MYLFGGKFCKFTDDDGQERECTCPEIISKHPYCECDRKHFNNILWATVTVFQVSKSKLQKMNCRLGTLSHKILLSNFYLRLTPIYLKIKKTFIVTGELRT